jgi:type IV pilus assembly protein PilO
VKDINLSDLDLDLNNIGSWPTAVKIVVIVLVCIIVAVGGYFLVIKSQIADLNRAEQKEISLKQEFEKKESKAVNLAAYKQQLKDIEESFGAMLRQLPSKTEVEGLLVDISQTGLASGIQFQLFKPEAERYIDFYAELPIKMKMTGTYHQFGNFISGVAALPRIVTLHNISITGAKGKGNGGKLTMEVTARTYRYLDEAEIAAHKKKKRRRR